MNQLSSGLRAVMGCEDQFCFTGLGKNVVLRAVLVSKGVSADNNWFSPPRDESGNVSNDNGLSEYCSIEDISNRAVGRLPHLLKVELLNSAFIRCNSRAFYTNFVLEHGV